MPLATTTRIRQPSSSSSSRRARSDSHCSIALDVVAAVVLDDDPGLRPAEVEAAYRLAVHVPQREVDPWLRQAREDQEHAQPGLHGRVDVAPDVRRRLPRQPARDARARSARPAPGERGVIPLRRTIQSPSTTSSTSGRHCAISTNRSGNDETRTPSWTTGAAPVRTWQVTPSRRSRSPATGTVTCSPGRVGIGAPQTRAAVAWLAKACAKKHTSAACARTRGVTGTVDATSTPWSTRW